MRKFLRGAVAVMMLVSLSTVTARAELMSPEDYEPTPGAALAAAAINVAWLPFRLALTVFGGALGGVTGFLTAGNQEAAQDVWGMFGGQNFISPDMMKGKESLRMGSTEFSGR